MSLNAALFNREHTESLQQYRVGSVVAKVHKQVIPESFCQVL